MDYPLTVEEVQRVIDFCRSHPRVQSSKTAAVFISAIDDAQTTVEIAKGRGPTKINPSVRGSLGIAYGELLGQLYFVARNYYMESHREEYLKAGPARVRRSAQAIAAKAIDIEVGAFIYWQRVYEQRLPIAQVFYTTKKADGSSMFHVYDELLLPA